MTNHIPLSQLTEEQINRFWSKVDIKAPNECWDWMGSLSGEYGRVKIQSRSYYTHRIAYFLYYTRDPKSLKVCHSCDNPICCNPNHLWLGTQLDNVRDRDRKGRRINFKGIQNGRAKLTESQVRRIRKQYVNGKVKAH